MRSELTVSTSTLEREVIRHSFLQSLYSVSRFFLLDLISCRHKITPKLFVKLRDLKFLELARIHLDREKTYTHRYYLVVEFRIVLIKSFRRQKGEREAREHEHKHERQEHREQEGEHHFDGVGNCMMLIDR